MNRHAVRPGSAGIVARFVVCVVDSWWLALWCRVLWWTVFAGSWLFDELVCGERQEEQLRYLILMSTDVDDDGASCDAASTRTVHSQSSVGSRIWTCRRSASDQQSRDSSSSERHSESHLRERPMELTGREEDFQQLSKKREAIFSGVIKESEMILGWAAEQPTEITTTAIDLEFLPTRTRTEECKTGVCAAADAHSWLSQVMKQITLSPTRGRMRATKYI